MGRRRESGRRLRTFALIESGLMGRDGREDEEEEEGEEEREEEGVFAR